MQASIVVPAAPTAITLSERQQYRRTTVTNLLTGEVLTVHLDLGSDLWLRNAAGDIEHVQRDQLPAERWRFDAASEDHEAPPPLCIDVAAGAGRDKTVAVRWRFTDKGQLLLAEPGHFFSPSASPSP